MKKTTRESDREVSTSEPLAASFRRITDELKNAVVVGTRRFREALQNQSANLLLSEVEALRTAKRQFARKAAGEILKLSTWESGTLFPPYPADISVLRDLSSAVQEQLLRFLDSIEGKVNCPPLIQVLGETRSNVLQAFDDLEKWLDQALDWTFDRQVAKEVSLNYRKVTAGIEGSYIFRTRSASANNRILLLPKNADRSGGGSRVGSVSRLDLRIHYPN